MYAKSVGRTARRARFIPVPLRKEKERENRGTEDAAGGEVIAREKLDSNRTAVVISEHYPVVGRIAGGKLSFVNCYTHQKLKRREVTKNCREAERERNSGYHDNLRIELNNILFEGSSVSNRYRNMGI